MTENGCTMQGENIRDVQSRASCPPPRLFGTFITVEPTSTFGSDIAMPSVKGELFRLRFCSQHDERTYTVVLTPQELLKRVRVEVMAQHNRWRARERELKQEKRKVRNIQRRVVRKNIKDFQAELKDLERR